MYVCMHVCVSNCEFVCESYGGCVCMCVCVSNCEFVYESYGGCVCIGKYRIQNSSLYRILSVNSVKVHSLYT